MNARAPARWRWLRALAELLCVAWALAVVFLHMVDQFDYTSIRSLQRFPAVLSWQPEFRAWFSRPYNPD